MSLFSLLRNLLVIASVSQAALFTSLDQIKQFDYDFIVVGSGAGGGAVANRLSAVKNFKVLVIEAGLNTQGVQDIIVPGLAPLLVGSKFDWNFTTVPQPGLNNVSLGYPRGFAFGGSTAINDIFYTRGSEDDYNRWASVTGDSGWKFENLHPFFFANEKLVPPSSNRNVKGEFIPSLHSTTGMVSVSAPSFVTSQVSPRTLEVTTELPNEFPFNPDMNSGKPIGVSWLLYTVDHQGQRSYSASSYLGPQFLSRPNLDVVINTRVTRLLTTHSGSVPTIRTVQALTASGETFTLTASKEVILSAGSIGTPTILLHSGIGDANELNPLGIKTIVNLPSVGKNLSDQVSVGLSWITTSTDPTDGDTANTTELALALAQWESTRTGPLTTHLNNHLGFKRLNANSEALKLFGDPSAGPNSPHIELVISPGQSGATHLLNVRATVVTPASRGSVTINSNNPLDKPLINPNFLSSPFDLEALIEGVQIVRDFATAKAWNGFVTAATGPFANATDTASIKAAIQANAGTVFHPVGSAAMSSPNAQFGVVNPDLTVKKVTGLRIVDASIMPFVTAGHTQVPVYVIAERAASLIIQKWT
ncbi:hypothetical protein Clacol_009787 [Clathrus columnatus]|uniref:Glucose-methanol-choline oxidoreductase N-terminal domain-containing protein n=1 Tax=Clathrus columnatus TaxID=1419009 RepID=A0AAV5ALL4_9AGAM|nr:hypothetical protein Clacol_009787 [Clathrus columnatus]